MDKEKLEKRVVTVLEQLSLETLQRSRNNSETTPKVEKEEIKTATKEVVQRALQEKRKELENLGPM